MMKRMLTGLLALVLALGLCAPALAAGGGVRVLTTGGPVRLGVRYSTDAEGRDASQVLFSRDRGRTWRPVEGEVFAGAAPQVCWTGRDYFMYYEAVSGAHVSADGIHWTAMPDRQWMRDSAFYGPLLSGLADKELELKWTGGEYMLRQSLRDDPRETHKLRGDGPRNKMVTFLDTEYRILGVMAFDAPVTAIRYQNGVYYATVDGAERAFTRADWYRPVDYAAYYGGVDWVMPEGGGAYAASRYVVRESYGDGEETVYSLAVSTDGRSWAPLENRMTPDMMRLQETGGALVYYCAYSGEVYYYGFTGDWRAGERTGGWQKAELGFDPVEGMALPWADYTFLWTGDGYLMRQSVTGRGGMMGSNQEPPSPYNSLVTLLDGDFRMVARQDLGAPVTSLVRADGVYYALAERGVDDFTIYRSGDGRTWTDSGLRELPGGRSAPLPPEGVKAPPQAGDVLAGDMVCRLTQDGIAVSLDGVYFLTLADPAASGLRRGLRAVEGDGATMLAYLDEAETLTGEAYVLDHAEAADLWHGRFGWTPTYVTLDGGYLGSTDLPFYSVGGCTMAPMRTLAQAMGLEFSYDAATRTATCTGAGLSVSVELGSSAATENGITRTRLAVPAQMVQGRFCVPVRFLAEAAGLEVVWDGESRTIRLMTPQP